MNIMSRIRLRYWLGERIWCRLGPPTWRRNASACGKTAYASAQPVKNSTMDDDHEGHRVALLALVQSRGDEPPQLEQDDRRGDEQSAEGRHLDPQRQWVEGSGDVEAAVVGVDAAVGVLQQVQHPLVEGGRDRRPEHERHHREDEAPAQLGQVLDERHRVRRRALLSAVQQPGDHRGALPRSEFRPLPGVSSSPGRPAPGATGAPAGRASVDPGTPWPFVDPAGDGRPGVLGPRGRRARAADGAAGSATSGSSSGTIELRYEIGERTMRAISWLEGSSGMVSRTSLSIRLLVGPQLVPTRPQLAGQLGQLVRAEQDQGDDQDDEELLRIERTASGSILPGGAVAVLGVGSEASGLLDPVPSVPPDDRRRARRGSALVGQGR